jgi:hypothetical protein
MTDGIVRCPVCHGTRVVKRGKRQVVFGLVQFRDNTFMNRDAELKVPDDYFLLIGINRFSRNYWGDYTGVDRNNDGFGDRPYHVFGLLNWDFHPQMTP